MKTESRMWLDTICLCTLFMLIWLSPPKVFGAADWGTCASDLDDVRQASDDASSAAEETQSAQEELESARDALSTCSGDCETERSEYDDARDDLHTKTDELRDDFSTLDDKISFASSSCEYELGGPPTHPRQRAASSTKAVDRCAPYKRYKGRLPDGTILTVCTKHMSELECKRCLGVK